MASKELLAQAGMVALEGLGVADTAVEVEVEVGGGGGGGGNRYGSHGSRDGGSRDGGRGYGSRDGGGRGGGSVSLFFDIPYCSKGKLVEGEFLSKGNTFWITNTHVA